MLNFLQRLSVAGLILSIQFAQAEQKLVGEGGKIASETAEPLSPTAQLQQRAMARKATKWWSIDMRLSLENDSNVRLDDSAPDKDDFRVVMNGTIKAKLPKVYEIQSSVYYTGYKDVYEQLDDFDLVGHTLGMSFSRPLRPNLYAFFDYAFVYFYFDGVGYLQRHTLRPSIYWTQTDRFAALIRTSWDNNDYPQEEQLSGDNYSLSAREFWYLDASKKQYLFGEYTANYNKAVEEFESFNGHRVTIGARTPLPMDFDLSGQVSYGNKSYKASDARFADTLRADNTYRGLVTLSHPVYRELLTGSLYYRYTRQRSSISARDYLDNVIGVELRLKF